jgi:DNA phosphorothioation-associated DGQHR protein 1
MRGERQNMLAFPFTTSALRVIQSLGTFYVSVLPAELLLETSFSDQLRATKDDGTGYELRGTQRAITMDRLREIAAYINRYDSAFPNSIILAANLNQDNGTIDEDDAVRWSIAEKPGCDSYALTIPSSRKLAAIIDGQHRLLAFRFAESTHLRTDLICSIFIDLPRPFQAQLFATINSTQKAVDKSITYELFGYNISDEPESYWSPDKLAVFLARKLNFEGDSPLQNRVIVAPLNDFSVGIPGRDVSWTISMATVVEGIGRLISTNPRRDINELLTPKRNERLKLRTSVPQDRSVLRDAYIDGNDKLIYLAVRNFLEACDRVFWSHAADGSFIVKTVGVQALFDILRKLIPRSLDQKDLSVQFFVNQLLPAAGIDFSNERFRNASGSGRTEIRRAIETAISLG